MFSVPSDKKITVNTDTVSKLCCKHWISSSWYGHIVFMVLTGTKGLHDISFRFLCHVRLLEWTFNIEQTILLLFGPDVPPWLLVIFQSVVLELLFLLLFMANDKNCSCTLICWMHQSSIRNGYYTPIKNKFVTMRTHCKIKAAKC